MPLADLIILGIILGFIIVGFKSGLIHTLGSLIGTLAGIYLASRYYEALASWLAHFTGWSPNFVRVLTFIISFLVINRLVGVVFWVADRTFGLISRLPILTGFDRLLGAILGLLEGIIVVGIALFFITKFPPGEQFMKELDKSQIAPKIITFTMFLWPLLPGEITNAVGEFNATFNLPKITFPKNLPIEELKKLKDAAFPQPQ